MCPVYGRYRAAVDKCVADDAAIDTHQCRRLTIEAAGDIAGDGNIRQADVAQAGRGAGSAEQRGNAGRRGIGNGQTIDGMAQAVELASEWHGGGADRRKAVCAPDSRVRRDAGVDIRAQHDIFAEDVTQALQVGAGHAAGGAQAVDHRIHCRRAIDALQSAEILAGWQVNLGLDVVRGSVAGGRSTLAIAQRQGGSARTAQRRIDIDIVVRRQLELVGRPHNRVVDIDIAQACATADRLDMHVGGLQRIGVEHAGLVAAGSGNREVGRIDQPGAGQALAWQGRGGDLQFIGHLDLGGRGFDKAAIAARRRTGVQRAGGVDRAGLHIAQQLDDAAARIDGMRLDHAGIVDHGFQEIAGGLGGEQHAAAIGLDQAAILHQRAHRPLVHRHVQQAVAGHVQRDGAARCQRHRTEARLDRAFVRHIGAQQGHIAARRADRPLVQHLAGAVAGKFVIARHEIGVIDIERGGHQPGRVHGRTLAEQDAVRVDDKHLAVGRQIAQDGRAVIAQHPVQGHRIAIGLHELHRLALVDIEVGPIDNRVLAALIDHRRAGRAGNVRLARHHRSACRPRQRKRSVAQHQRRRHAGQGKMPAAAGAAGHRALAGRFDVFGNGCVGTGGLVPDGAVDAIHGGS